MTETPDPRGLAVDRGLLADDELAELQQRALGWTAQELLEFAFGRFGDDLVLASSMGAEDVVLIDMLYELRGPAAKVFCLDTGRLPEATYNVIGAVKRRYEIHIELFFPQAPAVEELVRIKGPNLFYESVDDRKRCCHVRKVLPLGRALEGKAGWITGLRREQSVTRAAMQKLERDTDHAGIVKLNPLATWSREDVFAYIKQRGVPYNKLHDEGYPSIGCAPCTRAVKEGEDERAGRWWWESPSQKECGLHVKS